MFSSKDSNSNALPANATRNPAEVAKTRGPVRMPWWLFYPLVLATIVGAFYFARRDDLVTAVSIVVIALFGATGFRMGFGKILASFAAFAAAVYFAPAMGINYEERFAEKFGTSGLTNRLLCTALIGVLISLVVHLILIMVINRIMSKRRKLQAVDRYSGFAGGVVEGLIAIVLVLGASLSMQLWQRGQGAANQLPEQPKNNKVAGWVNNVASRTRSSAIGPIIQDYNPFERLELFAPLKQVHSTVQTLQQPAKVNRLLNDPRVDELKADPEFESAIESLRQDPEIKKWLSEGAQLDQEMVMRLMNHPAILRLVDQEDFLDRAQEVMQDLESR